MKSYVLSIVAVALVGGLCEELLRGTMRRYVRWISGLAVLLVIILPAGDAVRGLAEFFSDSALWEHFEDLGSESDYAEIMESELKDFSTKESERVLSAAVISRFSLDEKDLRVELVESEGQYRAVVYLSGKAIWQNPYLIELYVNETFMLACDVVIA
jgi:hypothetical protein